MNMQTAKQAHREARRLARLCRVNGTMDEARVRQVVHRVIEGGRPGALAVLSRFQRLVRLDRARHTANVESAAPLPADVRATIEARLTRLYGQAIVTSFTANAALIGGVRITVGSDVYDGSVKAGLAALERRL